MKIGMCISGTRILHTVGVSGLSDHGHATYSFNGLADEHGFTGWNVESMTFVKSMGPDYQAIIGMNVITQGRLQIVGDSISFVGPRENGLGL